MALLEKLISSRSTKQKFLLAFVMGAISSLAMAPTYLIFLLFITIPVLYSLLESIDTYKHAFLISGIWALGYFTLSLYWISFALFVHIQDYWWLVPFAILGIPFILSLFYGCAGVFYKFSDKTSQSSHNFYIKALIFSCCFFSFDLLRGYAFTGFPWNMIGYGWGFSQSMMQVTSLVGIWGLTFITWFICALSKTKKGFVIALAVIVLIGLFGYIRIETHNVSFHDGVDVALIQPNIKQEDKWDPEKELDNFKTLMSLSYEALKQHRLKDKSGDLLIIIWPETALTYIPQRAIKIANEIKSFVRYNFGTYLITGGIDLENEKNDISMFNSVFFINKHAWRRYDKKHLVPFGEYVPFNQYLKFMPITQQGFTAGKERANITFTENELSFSPLICYEAIFSGHVTSEKGRSDVLLNLTNDAWYKHSIGPYQHHDIVKSRAIEEGIPLIRVANTGISSIISPLGNTVYKENYGFKAIIHGKIPKPLQNATFYAKYKHTILWCLGVFCLLIPFCCAYWSSKENKQ